MSETEDKYKNHVGPVFAVCEVADILIKVIEQVNSQVVVQNHGAYYRVLVPNCCVLPMAKVEELLGRTFSFKTELEPLLYSFKGKFSLTDEQATWRTVS